MQAVMISAPHKSSGKTMIALALARLLRDRGLRVQMFKKGPDYIDPIWHRKASGRPSYNLDFNTQSASEIRDLFFRKSADADIVLVEGNHGLFDGQDVDGKDSNAALARLLDIPVMLVVDVTGFTRGIAPLLHGYATFEPGLRFQGALLNQCAGPRHRQRLLEVCARYPSMPILGVIERQRHAAVQERHLGLQPANEAENTEDTLQLLATQLDTQLDVDTWLQRLPQHAFETPVQGASAPRQQTFRLGIFQDQAFGFYYPDDLERFETLGAEIVSINSIHDTTLPEMDALFIGGGFPEMKAEALSANHRMREAVLAALQQGLPCYAECGGLMYLGQHIVVDGKRWPMAGFLPFDVEMQARPVGRGLMRIQAQDHPWPWQGSEVVHAHEFHHSAWRPLPAVENGQRYAWQVRRGTGLDGVHDGLVYKNTVAGYAHLRHTESSPWVDAFVQFIREKTR